MESVIQNHPRPNSQTSTKKVQVKSAASPAKVEAIARLSNHLFPKCTNKSQRNAISAYLNMASEEQLCSFELLMENPSILDNIANIAKFVRGILLLNGDIYGAIDLGEKKSGALNLLKFRDMLSQSLTQNGNNSSSTSKSERDLLAAWSLWKDLPTEVYLSRERISQYFKRAGLDPEAAIKHLKTHPSRPDMFTTPNIDTQQANVNWFLSSAKVILPHEKLCSDAVSELDDIQTRAVDNAIRMPVSFMHGSAGTGKTKTIGAIIKSVLGQEDPSISVVCAAFTHKAVKCIESRILAAGIPLEDVTTCTIDSLIGKLDMEAMMGNGIDPLHIPHATPVDSFATSKPANPKTGLQKQIYLILDEASMVSLKLLSRLAGSLKNNRKAFQVCIVGDVGQLRPIDRGEMFRHLVQREGGDVTRSTALTTCYRTSHQDLYDACTMMRNGTFPCITAEHFTFMACTNEDEITFDLVKCIKAYGTNAQYLAWRNEDVVMISNLVQKWILSRQKKGSKDHESLLDVSEVYVQRHYLPRGGFADVRYHAGDRVVFSGNKYKEVSRATLGTVTRIIKKGQESVGIAVLWDGLGTEMEHRYDKAPAPASISALSATAAEMDDDNNDESENNMAFMLAYCMTVHKSQGSEFERVVVPCYAMSMQRSFEDRRWLYTAMSRGKEHVTVIGIQDDLCALTSKQVPAVSLLDVQCV